MGVKEAAQAAGTQKLLSACLGHAAHAARVPPVINHLLERPAGCGRAWEGPELGLTFPCLCVGSTCLGQANHHLSIS